MIAPSEIDIFNSEKNNWYYVLFLIAGGYSQGLGYGS